MTTRRLVLASASPARLRLLQDAGFAPVVRVSGVPEDDVDGSDPRAAVQELALRKARAVATDEADALVLGCDSMLLLDGALLGKPADAAEATARWLDMRGRTGSLLTGHALVDTATGRTAQAVAGTEVTFAQPSEAEIASYVATGEPLAVAGAFTLDGRGSVFVQRIDGDHGNVIGLSLPLLRLLLAELDVAVTELWQ